MDSLLVCSGSYVVDNKGKISCDGDLTTVALDQLQGIDGLADALNNFAQFLTFDVEAAGFISGTVLLFWFTGYAAGNIVARMRR